MDTDAAQEPESNYRLSYRGLCTMGQIALKTRQCERTKTTFVLPDAYIDYMAPGQSSLRLVLDVGGYCPNCDKYQGPQFCKLAQADEVRWYPACAVCSSWLFAGTKAETIRQNIQILMQYFETGRPPRRNRGALLKWFLLIALIGCLLVALYFWRF